MNSRVLNFVAIGIVLLVGGGIGSAVLYSKLTAPPVDDVVSAEAPLESDDPSKLLPPAPGDRALATKATGPVEIQGTTTTTTDAPTPGPRPTWAEIESGLEKVRQQRKTNPAALYELEFAYDSLAAPGFTQSPSMVEHLAELEKYRSEFPQSPAPLLAQGKAYINYAWEARGSGFAYTVTEEGWELFRTRIAKARELLEQSLELGAKDGEIFAALLLAARGEGRSLEETRAVLEEGIKLDPAYMRMYTAMTEYLLPRWHGEPGDVERFAVEMKDRLQGDIGLDAFAHIALMNNQYDCLDTNALFRGGFDRATLVQAADVLVKRYPNARNLPCFAALCTMAAQDHAAARRIRPFVKHADAPSVPTWSFVAKQFQQWCDAPDLAGEEQDWVWGNSIRKTGISFAKNSRFIWCAQAGPRGQAAALLDLAQHSERTVLFGPVGGPSLLVGDARQNWLAASYVTEDFQGIAFWDAADPSGAPSLFKSAGRCAALAIHPEQPRIAWSEGDKVHVVDVTSGEELKVIAGDHDVRYLRFSTDGKRLLVTSTSLALWDTATWEKICDLPGPSTMPLPDVFCLYALDVDEGGRTLALATKATPSGDLAAVARHLVVRFDQEGKLAETLVSDLNDGREVDIFAAVTSPDRAWLAIPQRSAGPRDGRIDLWSLRRGKKLKTFPGHFEPVGQLTFSDDSQTLASIAQMGGVIKTWAIPKSEAR